MKAQLSEANSKLDEANSKLTEPDVTSANVSLIDLDLSELTSPMPADTKEVNHSSAYLHATVYFLSSYRANLDLPGQHVMT